jgi:ribose-phosphate pyrophosphokinase
MAVQKGVEADLFVTPEQYASEQSGRIESSRGPLLIASCRSGSYLAARVVRSYHALMGPEGAHSAIQYLDGIDGRFSDSENVIRLERDVSGCDVFLFQALYDPTCEFSVDQNYMAFLNAVRAFREWGANHVTAVLPYLAYARQDRPTQGRRESTTAKLMADLGVQAGIDRLVTWHPHSGQIHGFYGGMPVHALGMPGFFVGAYSRFRGRDDVVVVAPDAGVSKLVFQLGRELDLRSVVASKYRPRPEEAVVSQIMGNVTGARVAIVLDDMISSGGTVYGAVTKLVETSSVEEVYVGVSHNLCMEKAYHRMMELYEHYGLRELLVTNTIPQTDDFNELPFLSVRCLSAPLAHVVNRIHYNRPVDEVSVWEI